MNTVIKGRGNIAMGREAEQRSIGLALKRDRELKCFIYKAPIYKDSG